ncbi:MAG: hypothetical protein M1839_003079 [Geoglossum umbratile]|nr:MAG: hypothetical protein M1839_003079 [Geoglossum umbratile]
MAKTTTLLALALSFLLRALSVVAQSSTTPSPDGGSGDGGASSPQGGTAAGASGSDNGFVHMSKGVEIAVIIVVVIVGGGGIASAVFYYIAKKRQWEVRKSIRRSAVRLKNNLSTTNLQKSARRQTGATKIAEPSTPHGNKGRDVEKGNVAPATSKPKAQAVKSEFEVESPTAKKWEGVGFGKKFGR